MINNKILIYKKKKNFIVLYNKYYFLSVLNYVDKLFISFKMNIYIILIFKLLQFGCMEELGKINEYF